MTDKRCPSCGRMLESFSAYCPACGNELRNVQVSTDMRAFSEQLASMEGIEQKAMFIRNYPVPNTREDLLEFMITASGNLSADALLNNPSQEERNIQEAWKILLERCYQKAWITLNKPEDLQKIQEIYRGEMDEIAQVSQQKKINKRNLLVLTHLDTHLLEAAAVVLVIIATLTGPFLPTGSSMILLIGAVALIIATLTAWRRRRSGFDYLITAGCGLFYCVISVFALDEGSESVCILTGGLVILLAGIMALIYYLRTRKRK